jgi:hypothetical protein
LPVCFLATVTILLIIVIAPCLRQTPQKMAQGYCRGLVKTGELACSLRKMEHSTTVLFGSDSRIARQFSATSTASSSSESHDEHVRKFIPRDRIRSINDYLCVI